MSTIESKMIRHAKKQKMWPITEKTKSQSADKP